MVKPTDGGGESYRSVEEYLATLEKRRALEQSPLACVVMLGGPALLTHEEGGLPWLNRVACELPQRPPGPGGVEEPVRACYIGANNEARRRHCPLHEARHHQPSPPPPPPPG